MSRENVEIVRQASNAWNRRDLEWILEHIDRTFEFRTAQYFTDVKPVYRGHEGFRELWKLFREPWEQIKLDTRRMEDLGDEVLTFFTLTGRGRGSAVEVTLEYALLVTLRNGLALRMQAFATWAEALEAVGFSE